MAHRHHRHHHTHPLPAPADQPSHQLPKNRFGGLVGTLDHWTLAAHDGPRDDDNHIYLWIRINQGQKLPA